MIAYYLSLSVLILSTSNLWSKHTENRLLNQQLPSELFTQPVFFTRASVKQFIKHVYNHSDYGQKFLAFNFFHIITLLQYSSQSPQPRAYIKSIFRLFGQKLKSVSYINTYAFIELLNTFSEYLKDHVTQEKEKAAKTESIKQCIYNFLLTEFRYLKEEPEEALDILAEKVYKITLEPSNCTEQDISVQDVQRAIEQFLEIVFSKLIWSPHDQHDIWRSVKLLAQQLETLTDQRIISSLESLDALYWTLLTRFAYFLELSGADLDPTCYQEIQHDITQTQQTLWTLPEQEAFITPKKHYLNTILVIAQAKARAYQAGLISNCVTV